MEMWQYGDTHASSVTVTRISVRSRSGQSMPKRITSRCIVRSDGNNDSFRVTTTYTRNDMQAQYSEMRQYGNAYYGSGQGGQSERLLQAARKQLFKEHNASDSTTKLHEGASLAQNRIRGKFGRISPYGENRLRGVLAWQHNEAHNFDLQFAMRSELMRIAGRKNISLSQSEMSRITSALCQEFSMAALRDWADNIGGYCSRAFHTQRTMPDIIRIKRQTVAAERRGIMVHEFIHAHTHPKFWQWCYDFGTDPLWRNVCEGCTQLLTLEIVDGKETPYQTAYRREVQEVARWAGRAGVTADDLASVLFAPHHARGDEILARLRNTYSRF